MLNPKRRTYVASLVMSGLVVAFLLFDAIMKLLAPPVVLDENAALGYGDVGTIRGLGLLLFACSLLYVVPRTTVLGAILLTGYLGGTVATHVRVGNPLFTHVLFGVYLGILLWGGLYLRDARLHSLVAPRKSTHPSEG